MPTGVLPIVGTSDKVMQFTNESNRVRALIIDGLPWFVGNDVARALGYTSLKAAVIRHVDEEDRMQRRVATLKRGGSQTCYIINESGLYSLILSSKQPAAKRFKHWVTSEVLPGIRQDGTYSKQPMVPIDQGCLDARVRNAELERDRLKIQIEQQQAEIYRLKARIYDMVFERN